MSTAPRSTHGVQGAAPGGGEIRELVVLVPVHDDWEALSLLLVQLDASLGELAARLRVLVVDDGSRAEMPALVTRPLPALASVQVLVLRRNVGHQRAIAIGLAYIEANVPCDAVVIMDGDGEDAPADAVRLVRRCAQEGGRLIVFARRARRSEGPVFKLFYSVYRAIFRALTSQDIRVGNFSVVPRSILARLVAVSEIGTHYAAGVLAARIASASLPVDRAERLCGRSRMGFVGLVRHGLAAIAVHADIVGTRMLVACGSLVVVASMMLLAVVGIRLFTDLAIPGWATYAAGILVVTILQAAMLSVAFVFMVLSARRGIEFLPGRDHVHFILEVRPVRLPTTS